jgi:hypothetical protein
VKWEKLGLIWKPQGELDWAHSHATLPVSHAVSEDRWWVYVGCRDAKGKTRVARVTLDTSGLPHRLPTVCEIEPQPVISLGEAGTFDDSGVMPAWLVPDDGLLRLYYVGWNVIGTVPYRLSIGVAISDDGGQTFRRYSQGPIIDRCAREPFFATSPSVIQENGIWRMWYVSCTGWKEIAGRWEPIYHVKYAESDDGFDWNLTGISCVDACLDCAVARPCVFRNGKRFAMLFPFRSIGGYRTEREHGYRFGYAESDDGIHWERMDERVGIERSASDWDSEMIEYGWLQPHRGEHYLLYNGNGFGQSGFGMARLVAWE